MPNSKSRLRSQLGISEEKQRLLDKVKTLFDQKSRRLVIEIGTQRFSAAECSSFAFDPSADADAFEFTRPTQKASRVRQDLTYTARETGPSGNDISIEYLAHTPAVAASKIVQDLTYTADTPGAAGNDITVTYVDDGTAGAETVTVVGTDITVHMEAGVSTATQIKAAVDLEAPAAALVNVTISGVGGNTQTAQAETALENGANAVGLAGAEVVTVVGDAITVRLQSGVSTATQVKAAVDASSAAMALVSVSISGTGSNAQTSPVAAANLTNGDLIEYYNLSDITYIKRLRNKKYLVRIDVAADPAAD